MGSSCARSRTGRSTRPVVKGAALDPPDTVNAAIRTPLEPVRFVLPIIGARDYIEPRGFVIHECPACQTSRVFSVYDTRRKLTLYFIPTLNVRSQQVMECTTCHGRWGIPEDARAAVQQSLMSQEQIAQRLHRER